MKPVSRWWWLVSFCLFVSFFVTSVFEFFGLLSHDWFLSYVVRFALCLWIVCIVEEILFSKEDNIKACCVSSVALSSAGEKNGIVDILRPESEEKVFDDKLQVRQQKRQKVRGRKGSKRNRLLQNRSKKVKSLINKKR